MSEHLNHPSESIEQESQDSQIISGEQLLRSIPKHEFPPDYHFSAEQKYLFSTVSNVEDQTNFPVSPKARDKAIFTSFGLEYDDRRYPFTKQYRNLTHRVALSAIAEEVESRDEFIARLESKNEDWQKLLEKIYSGPAYSAATGTFHSTFESKRLEKQKYFRAISLWEKYENGPMNKTALRSFLLDAKRLYRTYGPEGRTIQAAEDYIRSQGLDPKSSTKRVLEIKKQYDGYSEARENLNAKASEYATEAFDALNEYLDSIGMNEARKYKNQEDKNSQRIYELVTNKVRNREIDMPTEEAEALLRSRLLSRLDTPKEDAEKELHSSRPDVPKEVAEKDLHTMINQARMKATDYYVTVIPELSLYAEKPKGFYEKEDLRINSEMTQLLDSKQILIDELANRIVRSNIEKIKARIIETIFPNTEAKDVYLLPTGAVIKSSRDGVLLSEAISPLSERILALFADENIQAAWRTNWAKHAHDYDEPIRVFLKEDIEQNAPSNADSLDKKLSELSKRFQIDYPEPLNIATGAVSESLQPDDYELLENLLPTIGGFIDGISLSPPEGDISLKTTRLEILSFLSGDREVRNSQLFDYGRRLKLRALETLLLSAGPDKRGKAAARLVPELGIAVFHHLDDAARAKFSQLVGAIANVSQTEFYRVFRKSVTDPKIRRNLVERAIFVNEFRKYLKGTSAMSDYFDGIKKKTVIHSDNNPT